MYFVVCRILVLQNVRFLQLFVYVVNAIFHKNLFLSLSLHSPIVETCSLKTSPYICSFSCFRIRRWIDDTWSCTWENVNQLLRGYCTIISNYHNYNFCILTFSYNSHRHSLFYSFCFLLPLLFLKPGLL